MKHKTIKLAKIALLLFVVSMSLYSCKKEGGGDGKAVIANDSSVSQVNEQNILKFLSITLGVKSNEINFSASDNSYTIRGIKMNRDSVLSRYANANEYKLNYENK